VFRLPRRKHETSGGVEDRLQPLYQLSGNARENWAAVGDPVRSLCFLSLGAGVAPARLLSKSLNTPSPRAFSGFQLMVGAWIDFGHEGQCTGRKLFLGRERRSPPQPTRALSSQQGSVQSSGRKRNSLLFMRHRMPLVETFQT